MAKGKERREIYMSMLLRSLAISLIGIFIPVYLVTLGFSIRIALVFLAVTYFCYLVFSPVAAEIAHRRGLKSTIVISPFITIVYIALLYSVRNYPYLLFPTAIVGGFASMLYWIPINSHFATNTDSKHVGEEAGYFHVAGRPAGIIGPLAGGLIITFLGFSMLYVVSIVLLLLCTVPLLFSKDHLAPLKRDWTDAFTKTNLSYMFFFSIQGVFAMCAALIFPFYVYLQTTNFETTGFVAASMGVGMLVSSVLAGKISDRVGKHKTMRVAAVFNGLVWIAALFFTSALSLYVLSVLIGLGVVLLDITIFGIFCDKIRTEKGKLAERVVFREVGLNIGRIFIFLSMAVLLTYAFELAFILAAASSLFFAVTKY